MKNKVMPNFGGQIRCTRLWEMCKWRLLIGGDDISNDVITFGTFFLVFLYSRPFPYRADWRKSDSSVDGTLRGIGGGIQIPERDVVASSRRRQSAP